MDTLNEPLIKHHRGIEMSLFAKKHGSKEFRVYIEFKLNGTTYRNAEQLANAATTQQVEAAIGKLEQWAHTVINDHVTE